MLRRRRIWQRSREVQIDLPGQLGQRRRCLDYIVERAKGPADELRSDCHSNATSYSDPG